MLFIPCNSDRRVLCQYLKLSLMTACLVKLLALVLAPIELGINSQMSNNKTFLAKFYEACSIHYLSWLSDNSRPTAEEANASIEKYFTFIYPETESAIGLQDSFRFILEEWRMKHDRHFPPLVATNKRQPKRVAIDSFGALT